MGRYILGLDIGSSSVKAALLDTETGKPAAIAFSPSSEMTIHSPHPGFAEQYPEMWWHEMVNAITIHGRREDPPGYHPMSDYTPEQFLYFFNKVGSLALKDALHGGG